MIQRRFWMRGGGSALAALAALFTTLCCLGFPALVGLFSALGAGFLLNDRYLEPPRRDALPHVVHIFSLHPSRSQDCALFALTRFTRNSVLFHLCRWIALP